MSSLCEQLLISCWTTSSWLCSTFLALFGSMFNTFPGTDRCMCLCCTVWTILAWILSLLLISLCVSFYSKSTCSSFPYFSIPPICSHKAQWCLGFHLLFSLLINEKSLGLVGDLLVIFTNSFKKIDVPVSNFWRATDCNCSKGSLRKSIFACKQEERTVWFVAFPVSFLNRYLANCLM